MATATALAGIAATSHDSLLAPRNIRGSESGTGEQLARFILGDRDSKFSMTDKTYLYLTGDKNRDILPNILVKGGAKVQSIMVYETRGSPDFSVNLSEYLNSVTPGMLLFWT